MNGTTLKLLREYLLTLHSFEINWKKNYFGRKISNTVGIRWKNLRRFSSNNLVEE
jgi:hypothetical protein